ncbi:hypothetical protein FOPG_18349 [Fusarium oxysporum f. sp. conglutinans race 2 54008]|uniref:Uncharacterized protein n=1 Tax=Fusarium oxysporum f. sp. conglutinans race 2 54008 TaxID=1089457 RepID=X0HWA4_FUSOX|nr:hypothetical protein FOPG_18349 [Fusarium oxysporum f. sp. conglutinans race 2 54008]
MTISECLAFWQVRGADHVAVDTCRLLYKGAFKIQQIAGQRANVEEYDMVQTRYFLCVGTQNLSLRLDWTGFYGLQDKI